MIRLFLPQTTLETWAVEEGADLKEAGLQLAQLDQTLVVEPAVHFLRLVSGADTHLLLTKVKTERQLEEVNAEHMADSVLLGDDAYEVETGFIVHVPGRDSTVGQSDVPRPDLINAYYLETI